MDFVSNYSRFLRFQGKAKAEERKIKVVVKIAIEASRIRPSNTPIEEKSIGFGIAFPILRKSESPVNPFSPTELTQLFFQNDISTFAFATATVSTSQGKASTKRNVSQRDKSYYRASGYVTEFIFNCVQNINDPSTEPEDRENLLRDLAKAVKEQDGGHTDAKRKTSKDNRAYYILTWNMLKSDKILMKKLVYI